MNRSILSHAIWGLILAGSLAAPAWSQPVDANASHISPTGVISDINVQGNQRIEARTIVSYLGLKPGDSFAPEDINAGLKNLYVTGFFADVKLLRQGNTLIVNVQENPVVSRVAFEGNDRIETKDLEKEVELKERSVYSRDKVQSDVKRILDIYRRSGRYNATVEPKIIQQDQNRVDLVYEITEGFSAKVEKITFIGNVNYDTDTLRKAVRTEETRWYKFLTDNDKYDPDRLQFDQELLRRFYTSEGYADFQVKSATAELSPDKESFYLTFVVDEGPKYHFGDVKITNEIVGKETPNLNDMITTKKGDTYDASKIEGSVDAITKELGNYGYAFVNVEPKIDRQREQKLANLNYTIKPGPRVYVERINITGNVRTLDEVVRREFRLGEGDPYNTTKLQRSEQRINNLGFFEKVNVKNEQGSAPDKTVVNVDVQEKSTGEINIGAGFSSSDGPLADFGVTEHNLLGRGQLLKSNFVLAARRKQAEVGFTEPYFLDRELSAGFDVYRTFRDFSQQSSYDSDVKGVNFRLGYALQEKLQHSVYYTVHENTISNVDPLASAFIRGQIGTNTTSAVGHSLTYDDRDNKFSPTHGYFFSFSQEVAGLGGDDRYLRHEIKTSYYYPIAPKWIASVMGSGGHIFGFSGRDVRISNRFFVGGDDFRGFENAGIGPRDNTTFDALGGNKYYVGTAELRFPVGLPDELGVSGAAFSDVGSLWGVDDSGPTIVDRNKPRVSAGVGILWTSPFGPIRVDFAKALVKEDNSDQTQTMRFSFGTRF